MARRCSIEKMFLKILQISVSRQLLPKFWRNKKCCHHIETSQLICCANQLIGLYMRATLALNGLNLYWRQRSLATFQKKKRILTIFKLKITQRYSNYIKSRFCFIFHAVKNCKQWIIFCGRMINSIHTRHTHFQIQQ